MYIGVFGIIVAGLVQFLDEKDRFFSSNISEITVGERGMYIGVALSGEKQKISRLLIIGSFKYRKCTFFKKIIFSYFFLGMFGFFLMFMSCQMIPPAVVSTLRTTEIVVAFITQSLLTNKSPQIIDTLGATFVIFGCDSDNV